MSRNRASNVGAVATQYVMDHRGPGPFKEHADGNPGIRWVTWKRDFEFIMMANKIVGASRAIWLLAQGGPDIQRLHAFLPPCTETDKDEYEQLVYRLDGYFKPKILYVLERKKFREMEPMSDERTDSFIVRLREQASNCNFGAMVDMMIIDQVIGKCRKEKLRERLCEKDFDINEVQKIASAFELNLNEKRHHEVEVNVVAKKNEIARDTRSCYNCGRQGHISTDPNCPAKGKKCRKCNGFGHFEKQCRRGKRVNDTPAGSDESKKKKSAEVRSVELDMQYSVFHVGSTKADIECLIGGVPFTFIIDSGSDVNILGYSQWTQLKEKRFEIWDAEAGYTEVPVRGYASNGPMKIKGTFMTTIAAGGQSLSAKFFVVENGPRALLSRDTSLELKVLKLGLGVNVVTQALNKIKGVLVELAIDENVKPVRQGYRRIPAALEQKVNEKLDQMLAADIIEEVNKPCKWVSAMVVEPKRNGDIRICIDMRQANKAIEREIHPLPTIEEMLIQFNKSEVFSILDIEQAFHQVELSENSRYITTFITSKGLYRYKRLMFGITCAPEKFQKILEGVLAGCQGCVNFIDDIAVYGSTREEHDRNLKKVLDRLEGANIKLNKSKCLFGVNEISFLGFRITRNGIKITEEKLRALKEMKEPKSVTELRGFLGFVNFVKQFIPKMATLAAPLYELLRDGKAYCWGTDQMRSFKEIISLLCEDKMLGYYDVNDSTELVTDASPVGLGAVLVQRDSNGNPRIICYASRSLSKCERKYAQTEKEALAIVWAVEKMHYYLYGKLFYIMTDHKPLEVIFGPNSKPCLRVERWVLRLASYTYKVVYQSGKVNIADPFSRMCQNDEEAESFDEISEAWVRQITEVLCPKAIKLIELELASESDQRIQDIKEAIYSGKWSKELEAFGICQNELCVSGSVVLRGTRIVIPKSLQQRTIELAHIAHTGVEGTLQLLRTKVWWPEMSAMVKKYVKSCRECLLNSLPDPPNPLKRRELPILPWIDIAVDYMGPLPTGESVFLIVDYYSRYQEVEVMRDTSARAAILAFRKIFGRNGYPAIVVADNGPQFVSQGLEDYFDEVGVKLTTTTPYSPQQNGAVERQNKDLKKFLQCCCSSGDNWKERVYDYQLVKNSSVNSVTGKTPAELFFKRQIKNKLPTIKEMYEGYDDEVRDRDAIMKKRGKEYADKRRHCKVSEIGPGDLVYAKNLHKQNKLDSNFLPQVHKVIERKGGDTIIEDCDSGKRYRRSTVHLKKIPCSDEADTESGDVDADEIGVEPDIDDCSPGNSEMAIGSPMKRNRSGRQVKKPARYRE